MKTYYHCSSCGRNTAIEKRHKALIAPWEYPYFRRYREIRKKRKNEKRSLSKNYLMVPKLTGCFPVMREARVGVQIGDT